MNTHSPHPTEGGSAQGTMRSYTFGFLLSVLLTLAAYALVVEHMFSSLLVTILIIGLALAQLLVQLIFFLHLGHEPRPRWNFVTFLFTVLIVGLLVGGSLWIMNNLNYNMMSPTQTNTYILNQEAIQK